MTSLGKTIPFSRPAIGEEEINEVVDTLRSGWLATGPKTSQFERAFADYIGVQHAVGTSSCTGALQIALAAQGIKAGDEVITSTLTFAATANVIVHAGAKPVFCDIAPTAWVMSAEDIQERITEKTRAVIAVHYAGYPCAMAEIRALCQKHSLFLIEDCAHAVGASLDGIACGAWGDVGAFSFYANKNMTTGEGGMLTTANEALMKKARTLRLQGISRDVFERSQGSSAQPSWYYEVVDAGFKHAMSDIQAAMGIHQLRKLPKLQQSRARLAERYSKALGNLKGLVLPQEGPSRKHAWHLYVVEFGDEAPLTRDEIFSRLAEKNIHCSVHFVPLHLQPYFRDVWGYEQGSFPRAEEAYKRILSLPLYSSMTDEEQDYVVFEICRLWQA